MHTHRDILNHTTHTKNENKNRHILVYVYINEERIK